MAVAAAVIVIGAGVVAAARRGARMSRTRAPARVSPPRLAGALLARYELEGGSQGPLGQVTSGERPVRPSPDTPLAADREARFEFGVIYLDRATGATLARIDPTSPGHP